MEHRPTRLSPPVVRAAAERMILAMRERCSDVSRFESARLVDQLAKALTETDDAYHRASLLQTEGWPIDERIVDIVHQRAGHEKFALVEAEVAWVMATGVRVPCDEGDVVTFMLDNLYLSAKVEAVFRDRARVVVRVLPDLVHGNEVHDLPAEHVVKKLDNGHPRGVDILRSTVGFRTALVPESVFVS